MTPQDAAHPHPTQVQMFSYFLKSQNNSKFSTCLQMYGTDLHLCIQMLLIESFH